MPLSVFCLSDRDPGSGDAGVPTTPYNKGYGGRHAGVDEAGRGPWAGPVVAAAVCLPTGHPVHDQVRDSKALSPAKREYLFALIQEAAMGLAVVEASVEQIDRTDILQATLWAMREALMQLTPPPVAGWIDGSHIPAGVPFPVHAVVRGDACHPAISAASIVAKVTRDRQMVEWDAVYPAYGFAQHKGYGTAAHQAALEKWGPCPIHRRSFAPIKRLLGREAMRHDIG